jgi:hypothetical protein
MIRKVEFGFDFVFNRSLNVDEHKTQKSKIIGSTNLVKEHVNIGVQKYPAQRTEKIVMAFYVAGNVDL